MRWDERRDSELAKGARVAKWISLGFAILLLVLSYVTVVVLTDWVR